MPTSTHARLLHRSGMFSAVLLLLLTLLLSGSRSAVVQADPQVQTGTPAAFCTPPVDEVSLSNPTVVTDCTQAGLQAALSDGGHITFDCGANPKTIKLTEPLVTSATEDIVLDGKGLITLDGQNQTRIMEKPFTPGSENDKTKGNDLTIQNMRFINAKAPAATEKKDGNARGGALRVTSPGTKLHIINSTFENNRTTSITDEDNQGGAIFSANIYETVIVGSVFTGNEAGSGGAFGGIATGLIVYNSQFTNNHATDTTEGGIVRGHGGALHLDGVTNKFNPDSNKIVDVCGSVFDGNTAVRGGGAIKVTVSDNKGTKATYWRSTFINNRLVEEPPAEGHGGAIYHIEDDLAGGANEDNIEIRESTFENNFAAKQGGAAWIKVLGKGRIVNTTFVENKASVAGTNRVGQGGALMISGGIIDIVNATFAENFATYQAGAIHAGGTASDKVVTLTNSLFYQNKLDPTHTNPVTTQWQGYHTNRELTDGGNNLQFPRTKTPDFDNDTNNLITAGTIIFEDPLLGSLADNGGPNKTPALQPGSPALDAGKSAACPQTDQRGTERPQGSGCDIGAFELVRELRLSPSLVSMDQGGFTLTVTGNDFTGSSKVLWDGKELTTTFVDSNTLQATVTSAQLDSPGDVQITVSGSDLPAITLRVLAELEQIYLPLVVR